MDKGRRNMLLGLSSGAIGAAALLTGVRILINNLIDVSGPGEDLERTVLGENKRLLSPDEEGLFDLLIHMPTSKYYKQSWDGTDTIAVSVLKNQFARDYRQLKDDVSENINTPRLLGAPDPNEQQMLKYAQSIADRLQPGSDMAMDVMEKMYVDPVISFQIGGIRMFVASAKVAHDFAREYGKEEAARKFSDRLFLNVYRELMIEVSAPPSFNQLIIEEMLYFDLWLRQGFPAVKEVASYHKYDTGKFDMKLSEIIYQRSELLFKGLFVEPRDFAAQIPRSVRASYIIETIAVGRMAAASANYAGLVEKFDRLAVDVQRRRGTGIPTV